MMGDALHSTATYGKGFKPTDAQDVFSIKIFVDGFANSYDADARVLNEIATFIKDSEYISFEVIDRRRRTFPLSYFKYKILFIRDSKTFKDQTNSNSQQNSSAGPEPSSENATKENEPYIVLNVSPNSTWGEISSAYHKMAQMYHPDKVVGLAPEYKEIAEKQMRLINSAFNTLKSLHDQ
ncbi:MAG: J domain-containing protein [Bacteroidetes bacterium]|jgi:hypothetical protein|nr:J domain-containing protein [Candidatus Neomarinimicrobiota bacterium]MBT7094445.1 J domain-containing protein [Bacteroidota bacterium]